MFVLLSPYFIVFYLDYAVWMFCILRCSFRRMQPIFQIPRGYKVNAISVTNHPELSLAAMVPDVLNYWDYQRNGTLSPKDIPYNYQGELWWKCSKGNDHIWSSRKAGAVDVVNHSMRRRNNYKH